MALAAGEKRLKNNISFKETFAKVEPLRSSEVLLPFWMNNCQRGIFKYQTANNIVKQKVTKKTWQLLTVAQ
jgi:hypothetical protein